MVGYAHMKGVCLPKQRKTNTSVDNDTLVALQRQGCDSVVLECRLAYSACVQTLGQVRGVMGKERVHPHYLPTQASGRWSTTDPPIPNWEERIQNIIIPDEGYSFYKYDYSAIEARLESCYSHDPKGLAAFRQDWDIHTLTFCWVYGVPEPPIKTKALNKAPECAEWRELVNWQGGEDRRRHLMKTLRYGLTYGPDKYAILNAKGTDALGITKDELVKQAGVYLESRPELQAMKMRLWQRCLETREARTFLGRRRRLFPSADELRRWHTEGKPGDAAKAGANHIFQGAVADVTNLALIGVKTRWPQVRLVKNTHDSLTFAVPDSLDIWPELLYETEKDWVIEGERMVLSTEWVRLLADGSKQYLT